jgi:hypothetical protein
MLIDIGSSAEPVGLYLAAIGMLLRESDTTAVGVGILTFSGGAQFAGAMIQYASGNKEAFRQAVGNAISHAVPNFIPRSLRNKIADEIYSKVTDTAAQYGSTDPCK